MRYLPLRKMPEEVILASQRRGNPVNVGLRASGRMALLAFTTWSGGIRSGSTKRDRDPHLNSNIYGLGHILPGSKTI